MRAFIFAVLSAFAQNDYLSKRYMYCYFFSSLFGYLIANFGALSRGQPHSPNVNHCVFSIFDREPFLLFRKMKLNKKETKTFFYSFATITQKAFTGATKSGHWTVVAVWIFWKRFRSEKGQFFLLTVDWRWPLWRGTCY